MALSIMPLPLHYDLWLVLLSYVVAVSASYTALDLSERVTLERGAARHRWQAAGAIAMGLGVWSMHFTGMLALKVPGTIAYGIGLTVLSMVVAVLASALALFLVARPSLNWASLSFGGIIMGCGIAAMHYTGMAAMAMPCVLDYTPWLFALSIAIAIFTSMAALWLAFHLRGLSESVWNRRRVGAALVMGLAICGMHYTGMAACRLTPFCLGAAMRAPAVPVSSLGAIAIGFGTLTMLAIALMSSHRARLQRQQELMKDRFLAILSHELRTPINAIMGFASILEDGVAGELTPDQRHYTERILKGADDLLVLVDDLLDVSRIQAGKFAIQPQAIAAEPVVADVLERLATQVNARGLRVTTDLAAGLPKIWADPGRLAQILLNLIGNALKFTPRGGLIRIGARAEGDFVRFEVRDSGIGIAKKDLGKLFRLFSQVDMSATRPAGGTGLGLYITKSLVEAHGGTIGIESVPEVGTTFTFTIPRADASGHLEGLPVRDPDSAIPR